MKSSTKRIKERIAALDIPKLAQVLVDVPALERLISDLEYAVYSTECDLDCVRRYAEQLTKKLNTHSKLNIVLLLSNIVCVLMYVFM